MGLRVDRPWEARPFPVDHRILVEACRALVPRVDRQDRPCEDPQVDHPDLLGVVHLEVPLLVEDPYHPHSRPLAPRPTLQLEPEIKSKFGVG